MGRNIGKEERIHEIWRHMGVYQDFIDFIGGTTKSISIQCKRIKNLQPNTGIVMLDDLIIAYNNGNMVHYTKKQKGIYLSRNSRDAGKYLRRFRKEVIEAINRRYDAGFSFNGMSREDVIDIVEAFFAMLL